MDDAKLQAKLQYESILELLKNNEQGEIESTPLSIEVRSSWTLIGQELEAAEFTLLLCTGGPAVRIIGELDQFQRPISARLEYQNWFTPWTEWHEGDEQKLIEFADYFLYGD